MCYLAKAFPSVTQHNHAAMHFNFFSALHRDSANVPFCTETEECLLFEPICESEEYEVRENPLLLYIEYVKLENKRSSVIFFMHPRSVTMTLQNGLQQKSRPSSWILPQ